MSIKRMRTRTSQTLIYIPVFLLLFFVYCLSNREWKPERFKSEIAASECACRDSDGQLHDFCYRLPQDKMIRGRRFSCEHVDSAKALGLLNTSHLSFIVENIKSPVFVTAFSSNHQREALNLVESIKKYLPKQRVIVYDLGKVNRKNFEEWNNLQFRDFDFSRYPAYVKNLREFRWKPIIIAEALQEFSAIWYMDSSISFKKSDLNHVYELINCRKHVTNRSPLKSVAVRDQRESHTEEETGWNVEQWLENVAECRKAAYLLHAYTGHGIYPATSEDIYKFIPTNFTEIKKPKAKMYEAGFVFAARTKDTVEKILKWYVLCALEEDCMAGNQEERMHCGFKGDRFSEPPKCHRFDQSVVNLLAANAFYYDRHYYASEIVDFFSVERKLPS